LSFSLDGRALAIACGDGAWLWDIPPPMPDDPECVGLAVAVDTVKTVDNGLVRTLTDTEWRERKKQLDARGGDCLRRTWDDLTEAEKLELRAPPAVRGHD
jgi:hypothetical protein